MRPDQYVQIEEAFESGRGVFIDVRSEDEYAEDHVPGAVNIPLLTNADRSLVGKIYHQQGNEMAKMEGFKLFAQRSDAFLESVRNVMRPGEPLYVYCWRGGSRSEYVLEMLTELQFPEVYKIPGGYKRYRSYSVKKLEELSQGITPVVLHGYTGAGKTDLLDMLTEAGAPVLCLETLAQNSGSVFGNVFFREAQPTQKRFESLLLEKLMRSSSRFWFMESESKRIGSVFVPDSLMAAMRDGVHINVCTTPEIRVENLLRNYVARGGGMETLLTPLERLRKRLGNEPVDAMIAHLHQGNYKAVIEPLLFQYYDPLYQYSIDQYTYDYTVEYTELAEAFVRLKEILAELERKPS